MARRSSWAGSAAGRRQDTRTVVRRPNSLEQRDALRRSAPPASIRSGRRVEGASAAPGPAPAGDAAVVAASAAPRAPPAPELGRPGVLRVLEQPVGERLLARPTRRCPSPRAPAGSTASTTTRRPPRRRPARSRRSTARRRRGARAPARRRPRSGRRAARSLEGGQLAASAWSNRRPPGPSRNSGRGGSTGLDGARRSAPAIEHHARPAAERRVVDRAVTVGGARRAGRGCAGRAARAAGPPEQALPCEGASTVAGRS